MGYLWFIGCFNDFKGIFSYDDVVFSIVKIMVIIDIDSIDLNYVECDKYFKSDDFLNVDDFLEVKFVSRKIVDKGNGMMDVMGDFMFYGVIKFIIIEVKKIGEGKDLWGGYCVGFMGIMMIVFKDYGIDYDLGLVL